MIAQIERPLAAFTCRIALKQLKQTVQIAEGGNKADRQTQKLFNAKNRSTEVSQQER
jgi:hypothetical protein